MNVFSYLQQIYAESTVPHLFSNHFKLLKGYVGDLPPSSRTNVMFVKSVTMENDGHEEEQI